MVLSWISHARNHSLASGGGRQLSLARGYSDVGSPMKLVAGCATCGPRRHPPKDGGNVARQVLMSELIDITSSWPCRSRSSIVSVSCARRTRFRSNPSDWFNTLLGRRKPSHLFGRRSSSSARRLVAVYFREPFVQPFAFPTAHVSVTRQESTPKGSRPWRSAPSPPHGSSATRGKSSPSRGSPLARLIATSDGVG
jgi:hypothetical protein